MRFGGKLEGRCGVKIFRLREKVRRSVLGRMKSSQEARSKPEVSVGEDMRRQGMGLGQGEVG